MEIVSIEKKDLRGTGRQVRPLRPPYGCHQPSARRKENERVDGQSGRVPDAEHQPTNIADASGQRDFGIQPNKPQDLLSSRRCAAHRLHRGGQAKRKHDSKVELYKPSIVYH